MPRMTKAEAVAWLGERWGEPVREADVRVWQDTPVTRSWLLVRCSWDSGPRDDDEVECVPVGSDWWAEPWTAIAYQDSPLMPRKRGVEGAKHRALVDGVMRRVDAEYLAYLREVHGEGDDE